MATQVSDPRTILDRVEAVEREGAELRQTLDDPRALLHRLLWLLDHPEGGI